MSLSTALQSETPASLSMEPHRPAEQQAASRAQSCCALILLHCMCTHKFTHTYSHVLHMHKHARKGTLTKIVIFLKKRKALTKNERTHTHTHSKKRKTCPQTHKNALSQERAQSETGAQMEMHMHTSTGLPHSNTQIIRWHVHDERNSTHFPPLAYSCAHTIVSNH